MGSETLLPSASHFFLLSRIFHQLHQASGEITPEPSQQTVRYWGFYANAAKAPEAVGSQPRAGIENRQKSSKASQPAKVVPIFSLGRGCSGIEASNCLNESTCEQISAIRV